MSEEKDEGTGTVIEKPSGGGKDTPPQQTETPGTGITAETQPGEKIEGQSASTPPKTYKVKVDGKELDVLEEDLIKGYSKSQAAYQRFSQAAQMKKDAEALLDALEKDPKEVLYRKALAQTNGDRAKAKEVLRNFGYSIMHDVMEEEALTDDEKKLKARTDELNEHEQRLKAQEAQIEAQNQNALVTRFEAEIEVAVPEALKKAGLPDTPATRGRMYQWWLFCDENGIPTSYDDIAREVKKERLTATSELAKTLSKEEFRTLFKDLYEACRQVELDALRQGSSTSPTSTRAKGETKGRDAKKLGEFKNWAEYSRWKDEQLSQSK